MQSEKNSLRAELDCSMWEVKFKEHINNPVRGQRERPEDARNSRNETTPLGSARQNVQTPMQWRPWRPRGWPGKPRNSYSEFYKPERGLGIPQRRCTVPLCSLHDNYPRENTHTES